MNLHTLNVWAIRAASGIGVLSLAACGIRRWCWGPPGSVPMEFASDPPAAGARGFLIAFVLSLVMAVNLAMFLNAPGTTTAFGATAGFLAGAGWVAAGMGIVALFEHRPWRYVVINGGYFDAGVDGDGRDPGRMEVELEQGPREMIPARGLTAAGKSVVRYGAHGTFRLRGRDPDA